MPDIGEVHNAESPLLRPCRYRFVSGEYVETMQHTLYFINKRVENNLLFFGIDFDVGGSFHDLLLSLASSGEIYGAASPMPTAPVQPIHYSICIISRLV